MTKEEITEFAQLVVRNIRDNAIRSSDNQLHAQNMNAPIAKRWREARESGDIDKFGESIIADCVDDTIFYLLLAIDEGLINLSFKSSSGKNVALSDEIMGELGGWYMGEWRSEYSSERYSHDLDDL
jgi:hypothetical protein